jgi:hypothetical protein
LLEIKAWQIPVAEKAVLDDDDDDNNNNNLIPIFIISIQNINKLKSVY